MAGNGDSDRMWDEGYWCGDEEPEDPCGGCGAADPDQCICEAREEALLNDLENAGGGHLAASGGTRIH